MRRVVRILPILVGIAVLLGPAPAQAKIPPFSVELEPRSPNAGEPVTITVRLWEDAAHTDPARWPYLDELDDFIWAAPMVGADEDLSEARMIDLIRSRRGVYRGEVVLPSAGRWSLCTNGPPCRTESRVAGHPGQIMVNVRPAPSVVPLSVASSPVDDRSGPAALATGALVVAVASVAAGAGLRRSHRRRVRAER